MGRSDLLFASAPRVPGVDVTDAGWRTGVSGVAVYVLTPQGRVITTIAGHEPGGTTMTLAPVFYWRIDAKGKLLLSGEAKGASHIELVLPELDISTASVWNVGQSAIERHACDSAAWFSASTSVTRLLTETLSTVFSRFHSCLASTSIK